jgi:hypothetical protein
MARIEAVLAGEKSWGQYALDVLGHAGLGTAYALPFEAAAILWFGWAVPVALGLGAAAALVGGVLREIVQAVKSGKLHALDRALDALHHLLGGPIALLIVLILKP